MPIRIVAVGKLGAPWQEAAREYEKRLGRYDRIEVLELGDLKEPVSAHAALIEEHKRREGELILKRLGPQEHIIALCPGPRQLSSEAFADHLQVLRNGGKSPCFVIGGSMGLSSEVIQRADEQLSLSELIFPHQLARVVLLEQLYRAFKILGGERYHK